MAKETKNLIDYFIERTDKKLELLEQKIDRLLVFGGVIALVCVACSPAGAKLIELAPKIFEVAGAIAGMR